MGLFELIFGSQADLNEAAATCEHDENALLVDVRTMDEYASGHVPGSINIPVGEISSVRSIASSLNAPIFLYCASGARSGAAKRSLESMGFTAVENAGSIRKYRGALVS